MSAEQLEGLLQQALRLLAESPELQAWEPLPDNVRQQQGFMPWAQVLLAPASPLPAQHALAHLGIPSA